MSQNILVLVEHLQGKVLDISYVMLAAGRVLAQGAGGSVVALVMGHNAKDLANDLNADEVQYMDHPALKEFTPDAYLQALGGYLQDNPHRAVLMGHTSIGMDVASGLSVRSGLPLVSQCQSVSPDGAFSSQICGGKIMAEGELPQPSALVTMVPGGYKPEEGQSDKPPKVTDLPAPDLGDLRVQLREYIEPEAGDVDISKESILVAVGRGLQNEDDIEIAEELAQALGGSVCATRPIVDQGWLPTTRLVGKSGLGVKPKVYLALGISGAPEHVQSITDSDVIIAINTDSTAPIFNMAQYGAEIDMIDFAAAMTEQLQAVKED